MTSPAAGSALRASIVTKLTLLVLVVGLPLFGLLAWAIEALLVSKVAAAEQFAISVARAIADRAAVEVRNTRTELQAIAGRAAVQSMDRSRCDPFLRELHSLMPQRANINSFNLEWELICSASGTGSGQTVRATRDEIDRKLDAGDEMVLSTPVRGRLTGRMVVLAAYPVTGSGRRLGAVVAPLDLSVLASSIAGASLPPGTIAKVINEDGLIVLSYPESERIGELDSAVAPAAGPKPAAVSIGAGPDKVERHYASAPVKGTGWVARAEVPTAWAMAGVRRQRDQTFVAIALTLAISGAFAVWLARWISRPIRALQRDAEALTHRPPAQRRYIGDHDEVGQLAVAFKDMARTAQSHEADRKQVNDQLRESERRFSSLLETVQLASVMLDREARITYCNPYLLQLTGWQSGEVIGRDWFETFMPAELGDMKPVFAALLQDLPQAWHRENEIITRSGERRLFRWSNSVLRSLEGDVVGTASIGEDITEQRRAEVAIKHANRVHAMLSGINTLIVHAIDLGEFFAVACRIVVRAGGMRMAFIVMKHGAKLVPVAHEGMEPALMAAVAEVLSSPLAADTLVARTIATKQAIVCNDSVNDPGVPLGHLYTQAGVRSIVFLPLIVADDVVGVFVLFAAEADFFHEQELSLLNGLADDISHGIDHIEKRERLDYLAYYDALTGLANRTLFLERVAQQVRGAGTGDKFAVFLLDLERFKNINDAIGRVAGDEILRQVAHWLELRFGGADMLARVDADRFAVLLPDARQAGEVARSLEKLLGDLVEHSFRHEEAVLRIAAKVGVALYPDDATEAETLLTHAEAALKKAKARGNRYLFYTQAMSDAVAGRLALENQLREALDRGEFVLHYQPKVSLASGRITGAEALIRWNDPRTGLVPPLRFIPVLEETGLIHEVGRWALRQAIADGLRWRTGGMEALRIGVNVSPLQLRSADFVADIAKAIGVDPLAASCLELEITESLLMEDVRLSALSLEAVRAMGVSIAIDDFGTGFSSLSYLAKLPVDILKIDRSFIVDMTTGPEGLALVSTIIKLAQALKIRVAAEGVETEEQRHLLRLLSCDEMQGFLFCKPLPAAAFEARFLGAGSEIAVR